MATDTQITEHNKAVIRDELDRLVDTKHVEARLGVGRSTVFALIGSGELRSVKIGRRRLVPESALNEFIAKLQQDG